MRDMKHKVDVNGKVKRMAEAYIVDAVRTAGGKRNGKLMGWHPVDMAAATLDALVARTGIDGASVEDVIMGCVMQGGQQAGQVGRNAVLACRAAFAR